MEKLTLEQIAPFLPYGLKVKYNQSIFYITSTTVHTTPVLKLERYYSNGRSRKYFNEVWLIEDERYKPLLRPMDLTKPIIVEGKEIIPIVELAKIALAQKFRYDREFFLTDIYMKYYDVGTSINFNELNCFYHFTVENNDIIERKCFSLIRDNTIHYFLNQLQLFQWLYKHKFDVENLIEKGLAIDVNTLETNPYN